MTQISPKAVFKASCSFSPPVEAGWGVYNLARGSGARLAGRECHMSTRADSSLTPSRPRGDTRSLGGRQPRSRRPDQQLHGDRGQPSDPGVVAL